MRRKSRILLCFAVLWVLGIAYYFYSGTALSRKVGFHSATLPVSVAPPRPCGCFLPGQSDDGAGRLAALRGLHRCCGECDKGPASISGQALIWWSWVWTRAAGLAGSACTDPPLCCACLPVARPHRAGRRGGNIRLLAWFAGPVGGLVYRARQHRLPPVLQEMKRDQEMCRLTSG